MTELEGLQFIDHCGSSWLIGIGGRAVDKMATSGGNLGEIPYLAVGNDEIGKAPFVGETYPCKKCGESVKVKTAHPEKVYPKGEEAKKEPNSNELLDGLPAELRKAAKCWNGLLRHGYDEITHEGEHEYWLPAGLVGKEMRRIKEEETNRIYLKLIKNWARIIKDYGEHKCSGTDGDDICFTKKSFEYAFGKCKCDECTKEGRG